MPMKRTIPILAAAVLLALGLAAGYWWGAHRAETPAPAAGSASGGSGAKADAAGRGRILYYRNPMGLPDTSPVPKKDPMGMDYVPVYEGGEPEGPALKITLDKV